MLHSVMRSKLRSRSCALSSKPPDLIAAEFLLFLLLLAVSLIVIAISAADLPCAEPAVVPSRRGRAHDLPLSPDEIAEGARSLKVRVMGIE